MGSGSKGVLKEPTYVRWERFVLFVLRCKFFVISVYLAHTILFMCCMQEERRETHSFSSHCLRNFGAPKQKNYMSLLTSKERSTLGGSYCIGSVFGGLDDAKGYLIGCCGVWGSLSIKYFLQSAGCPGGRTPQTSSIQLFIDAPQSEKIMRF